MTDAVDLVFGDLEARLQGRTPDERARISGDLLLLPGLLLEDDLEPADGHLDDLRRSQSLKLKQSGPDPSKILTECLGRQEYRRAREIIETHQLGDRAQAEYQRAVNAKRSSLRAAVEELELQIEDAYLLGQLRDDTEAKSSTSDPTRVALERSQLLGVVRDARARLSESADSDADELRIISLRIDKVADDTQELTTKRRERLHREFVTVMEQLPPTEQGEADRSYLREAFDDFMKHDDHVAAFDLPRPR